MVLNPHVVPPAGLGSSVADGFMTEGVTAGVPTPAQDGPGSPS